MSRRGSLRGLFKTRDEFDLTSGGIGRPLFYLALPIVITNLFQTAYNLADTFWLGQYNTNALAAISFAFPMVFLVISLAIGLSVAGSVLVAQYVGAGKERRAEYAASQTIAFSILVSLVLGVVGYFSVDVLVDLLGANDAIAPLAAGYMRVFMVGLVFVFGFAMFISLMRGYGDTVTPMVVMFVSVVINIVLDPFLIFGFESNPLFGFFGFGGLEASLYAATGYAGSGIQGAAVATIGSRAIAFVIGLWIMFRGDQGVRIRLSQMVPDLDYARKMLALGVPASVEGTVRAVSINLLLVVVASFSTTVVASYGIGTRIFSVVFLPAIALSQGVETMTGQNIGAGKADRADRTNHVAAAVLFVILSAVGVVAWLFARPIAAVFTTDPAVVATSATFIRYAAPTFGFIGIMRVYTGGFRGAGLTMVAALVAVGTLGLIRLPVAWFGAGLLGVNGLWLSFPASNVLGAIASYLWFRRGTWRDRNLANEEESTHHQRTTTSTTDD